MKRSLTKCKGTEKEKTLVRKPYLNYPVFHENRTHKMSTWMAQSTDRLDAFGVPIIARHILTKATPTTDYSNGEFHKTWYTEEEDFTHQFYPVIRTKEYRESIQNDLERTSNVLEHLYTFCETAVIYSPYSRYDSPFFISRYIQPLILDELRFLTETTMLSQPFSKEEKEKIFADYFRFSSLMEPADNTQQAITLLAKKFPLLSKENQWTHGFQFLLTRLYPKWYHDTRELLSFPPYHKDKTMRVFITDFYKKAKKVTEVFNPVYIKQKPLDLKELLQSGVR